MKEIQITSTVLYFIVLKLKEELAQGYINNVQTIDKNIWKIKIHKKKTKDLIVTPNICFVSKNTFSVNDILGFEKYLKKVLYNQKIHEIYQDKNNKVICFKLDRYNLIFEFFSKSNIILTDLDFKIITSKQKEEWKDRTIKKGGKYLFPAGEDIKNKSKLEVKDEIEGKDEKEIVRYLSRTYNVAPVEINEDIKNKKDIVEGVFEKYNYENPGIKLIEKNESQIYILVEKGEDIFDSFEKIFKDKFQEKEVVLENVKKNKINSILKAQEESKNEFLEKIKILEKEGEFIYSNFNLIETINDQINKALLKEIDSKEIIEKLNDYFKLKKIDFKINKIDKKNKTYQLEKIEKKE
jgi:predicted ribosome quality control (RQC) complex YloA/Tae2 family protein